MSETKFLYGAAVQGIQGFIFQTNKLREIVGASALVEEICTDKFKEMVGSSYEEYDVDKKCGSILHAAGNIKYVFDNRKECERIVRLFPMVISDLVPGITVSQAVVEMTEDMKFAEAVEALEHKLRIQRNRPMRSVTMGLMGIERSRQTGLPVSFVKSENRFGKVEQLHLDQGTRNKLYEDPSGKRLKTTKTLCEKAFGQSFRDDDDSIAYNIEDITRKNDWIAIIHADGNGLGQVVQKVGKNPERFKTFSEWLDEATRKSAVAAFQAVEGQFDNPKDKEGFIPIRPIVLGGDDLTVVCRADLALDYTATFLAEFEKNTRNQELLEDVFEKETDIRLTACAGIAFIKSSFPFYYGYNLAEELCSQAKKDAKEKQEVKEGKELPMSCLMFHKVQDSFTENYSDIVERELTPRDDISFKYGPYYLKEKPEHMTIKELKDCVAKLVDKEGNAIKSHLRQWMSLLHYNPSMAQQKLRRLRSMTTDDELRKLVDRVTFDYPNPEKEYKSPVYDILAIHTIINQETKEDIK